MKERIESLFSIEFLRWIIRIRLRLKCSSPYGGSIASNDDSWWPLVVVNGGGGVSRVIWQSLEREGCENHFFMLKNVFIFCRSHLANLSR